MAADDEEGYDLADEVEPDEDYGRDLDDEDDEYEDDEEGGGTSASEILGPNGPRVCAAECSTCIFRPGNLMRLRPGRVRQMVRDSLAGGGFITCHSTLPGTPGEKTRAVCAGFFKAYGHQSNLLRVWSRLGDFDMIEPPCLHGDKK